MNENRVPLQKQLDALRAENARLRAERDECQRERDRFQHQVCEWYGAYLRLRASLGDMLATENLPVDAMRCLAEQYAERLLERSDKAEAERDAALERVKELEQLISDEPRTKTRLPDEFQRLWQACNALVEKAEFKAVFRYWEKVEELLREARSERDTAQAEVERLTKLNRVMKDALVGED